MVEQNLLNTVSDSNSLPVSNLVLYLYDIGESKFIKAGTITKNFYYSNIEPKIVLGSPEREIPRQATVNKLIDLNGFQFIDIFDNFNNETGIEINDPVKNKKFAEIFTSVTSQNGYRNTFANILSLSYGVSKSKIVNSKYYLEAVSTEPVPKLTMSRLGKGELFLCFYGDGKKGKLNVNGVEKGDVFMNNILFELKKNDGRIPVGVKVKPTKEVLNQIIEETNSDTQIDLIVDMLHKAAGVAIPEKYNLKQFVSARLSDILSILKHNVKPELVNLQFKFLVNVIGVISLIGYFEASNFDRLVLFDISGEVEFISINLRGDITVEQLFNIPDIKYKLDYSSILGHQIKFN